MFLCEYWQLIITLGVNDEVSKCHERDGTVCYGKITNLTLRSKFKVKGHQQWYATHCLEVVYLYAKYEKPILNDKTITDRTWFVMDAGIDLTLRSKFKIKGHQQWYVTHRLEVVYLHAKYEKPVLNDKKVTAQTRFVTDARMDRVITNESNYRNQPKWICL